jgi:FMN hydrolase / 5-amino-6-(5-phospho-D-ribitylamino)uracil phosphatase
MLSISTIRAITFDLDDTLWPIWPVIERAEKALLVWLSEHAPMTAALFASSTAIREIREDTHQMILKTKPHLAHDLSAIRLESIRLALYRAGDDPMLAQAAFDVFFEARHSVEFYADALPAIQAIALRYPLISVSNGNARLDKVGLAPYFQAAVSASRFGVSKPDAKIFYEAARLAQVSPQHMLHVGDDANLDVLGALSAGMQAVWLNRHGQAWPHQGAVPTLEITSLAELTDCLAC